MNTKAKTNLKSKKPVAIASATDGLTTLQRNNGYTLEEYYRALKYNNLDPRNEQLALGIIKAIDEARKPGKSSKRLGLYRSILRERVEVMAYQEEGKKPELVVTSINIPRSLQAAFVPEKAGKGKERKMGYNNRTKNSREHRTPPPCRQK